MGACPVAKLSGDSDYIAARKSSVASWLRMLIALINTLIVNSIAIICGRPVPHAAFSARASKDGHEDSVLRDAKAANHKQAKLKLAIKPGRRSGIYALTQGFLFLSSFFVKFFGLAFSLRRACDAEAGKRSQLHRLHRGGEEKRS